MNQSTDIPARGTKEFAKYAAGVMAAFADGAKIKSRRIGWEMWRLVDLPAWDWLVEEYCVVEEPHPIDQWRAMSPEERKGKVLELSSDGVRWTACRNEGWITLSQDIAEKHKAGAYLFQIRDLTLAERNAEVRERWEAMEATDDVNCREKDGKRWMVEWNHIAPEHRSFEWHKNYSGEFSQLDSIEYRLVEVPEPPKPKLTPWTRETCPVGAVVKGKTNGNRAVLVGCDSEGLFYGGNPDPIPFERAIRTLVMDDGSPCGTEVA